MSVKGTDFKLIFIMKKKFFILAAVIGFGVNANAQTEAKPEPYLLKDDKCSCREVNFVDGMALGIECTNNTDEDLVDIIVKYSTTYRKDSKSCAMSDVTKILSPFGITVKEKTKCILGNCKEECKPNYDKNLDGKCVCGTPKFGLISVKRNDEKLKCYKIINGEEVQVICPEECYDENKNPIPCKK